MTGTDFPQQHFRTSGPGLSASRIIPRIGLLAATIFCFGQVSGCGGGFFRTGIRQRASRFVESGEQLTMLLLRLVVASSPSWFQLQVVSVGNRPRSRPRGVRRSASSTTAFCHSRARLSWRPSREQVRPVLDAARIVPAYHEDDGRRVSKEWFGNLSAQPGAIIPRFVTSWCLKTCQA